MWHFACSIVLIDSGHHMFVPYSSRQVGPSVRKNHLQPMKSKHRVASFEKTFLVNPAPPVLSRSPTATLEHFVEREGRFRRLSRRSWPQKIRDSKAIVSVLSKLGLR